MTVHFEFHAQSTNALFKPRLLVVIVCFVMSLSSALASDYSEGLSAYINGDYHKAQKFWLTAADNGDSKSMFNLGLMYEKSKLVSTDADSADQWYRKAAHAGYPAAGYHLAQRLATPGGLGSEALVLMKASADMGYLPAIKYLEGGGGSVTKPVDIRKPANVTEVINPVKKSADFQVEEWVNKQNNNNWTVQLLAFTDEAKVKAFIAQHQLQTMAAYFTEKKDGVRLYKLIYGSFSSKEEADLARKKMSPELQKNGPWLRPIASIQAITKG